MATGQIEKQQFKNNTSGWIGATVIAPNGQERGISVEPEGTVWLSEAEQVLTANAPRKAKDNPFIEQTQVVTDPTTGEKSEVTVTPLEPITANRFVPAGIRYVPGASAIGARGLGEAQVAATGEQPITATQADMGAIQREQEVKELGEEAQPFQPPPVPRSAAAAVAAAGALSAATPEEHMEETAAAVPEETGAATPPTGPAPEGEYQAQEEVGTPVPAQPETTPAPAAPEEETAVTPAPEPTPEPAPEPAPADVAAAQAEESAEQAQVAAEAADEAAEEQPQPAPYTPPQE